MIAIKITVALIFAFLLFLGAFLAISKLIFDRVEISDHLERMELQKVKARKNDLRKQDRRRYLHR